MSEKYKIEYAKSEDAPKIIELVHKVIDHSLTKIYPKSALDWFYNYHSIEHLTEEIEAGADVAVIYDGDTMAATGTYYDDELKRLFVHPEYQRAGLGKMLMAELEDKARQAGRAFVMLYANPATWRYYQAKGYYVTNFAAEPMEKDGEYFAYCTMSKHLKPSAWNIRKATVYDAQEILTGQKAAFHDVARAHNHMDMPPMSESVQEVVQSLGEGVVFIAQIEGRVVGSVRGSEKDGACYISRLWVLPEYRGIGIAQALMYAVEDAFSNLNTYKLFTGSMIPDTIEFYKERGYAETSREPEHGYELVHMEKMNAIDFMK
jgi:GNAT superfamily N-acetyltransferase